LAINGLSLGSILSIGPYAKCFIGNTTFLKNININTKVCLLQNNIYGKSVFIRATGSFGLLLKKSKNSVTVKMPSGFLKIFNKFFHATIGGIFNFNYLLFRHKMAGYNRLKGFRPTVRGVAMNPVDHPFGGGEGKKSKKSISMSP
jgi:large subunit ribosomal protein L2